MRAQKFIVNSAYTELQDVESRLPQRKDLASTYLESLGDRGAFQDASTYLEYIGRRKKLQQTAAKLPIPEVLKSIRELPFLSNVRTRISGEGESAKLDVMARMDNLIGVVNKEHKIAFRLPPVQVELRENLSRTLLYTRVRTNWVETRHFARHQGRVRLGQYQAQPHCTEIAHPCLGSFETSVNECIRGMDFRGTLCLLRDYLCALNGNDGAGKGYEDFLYGDPNIRLYSRDEMMFYDEPGTRKRLRERLRDAYNYNELHARVRELRRWSPKWSRWGILHEIEGEKRFYVSPNEYVILAPEDVLKDRNVTYSNNYSYTGRTLCPSLALPMPDIRPEIKVDLTRTNRYPLYKKVRIISERVHTSVVKLKKRKVVD